MRDAFIVSIDVRRRSSSRFSARSDDLPGLHVSGDSPEAVRRSAILAVQTLYKRNDHIDVDVRPENPDAARFYDAPSTIDRLVVSQRA
jgi:hypothetical protein